MGQSVTDVLIISDDTLRITFSNGDSLSLIDDTDQYESFVITSGQLEMVIQLPIDPWSRLSCSAFEAA